MRIYLIIVGALFTLLINAQNTTKLIKEANNLYKSGKYEQALKVCEVVLMGDKEDVDGLSNKASASWISCWIYKKSEYSGIDINKSYKMLEQANDFYRQLVTKYPDMERFNLNLIAALTEEKMKMLSEYPGCENGVYKSPLSKVEEKAENQPNETVKNVETSVAVEQTNIKDTANSVATTTTRTDKAVTITVSGSGKTIDEAKQNALRSAIEQAFGAFISSKTEIFNDQLVADQMSTVSSGNIQSYDVLNQSQFPDNTWGITLKALVSIDKLTSFVGAKGVTVEFKGGLFAQNIKQQILNEEAEVKAIANLIGLLHEPMQTAFDYTIKSDDPKSIESENKNWKIPLTVNAIANKNMDFCVNYLIKTLTSLSLKNEEIENYKKLNKEVYPVTIQYNGFDYSVSLRNKRSFNLLFSFASNWFFYINNFFVDNGIDSLNVKDIIVNESYNTQKSFGYDNIEQHQLSYYAQFEKTILIQVPSDKTEGYDPEKVKLKFPNNGQIVHTFSFNDIKSLEQLDKIIEYKVIPKGIQSKFKHGGYVIYENNGYNLIASIENIYLPRYNELDYNFYQVDSICKKNNINGYNDWRIPTIDEFDILNENLFMKNIGNLGSLRFVKYEESSSFYWKPFKLSFGGFLFNSNWNIISKDFYSDHYSSEKSLRPVRSYNSSSQNTQNYSLDDLKWMFKSQFGFVSQAGELNEYYGDIDYDSKNNIFLFNIGCGRGPDIIEIIIKPIDNKVNSFDIFIPKGNIYFGDFTTSDKKVGEFTIISENEIKGNIRLCLEKDSNCCGDGLTDGLFVMKKIK